MNYPYYPNKYVQRGCHNAFLGNPISHLKDRVDVAPWNEDTPKKNQISLMKAGFRSYISLKKREIRKKINRLQTLDGYTMSSRYFNWVSSPVRGFARLRLERIKAKYQEQLTELDKQLNS